MDKASNSNDKASGGIWKNKEEIAEMIFVYTVHFLFMNIKADELHEVFKDNSGRRTKRVGLFTSYDSQENLLGMSRNRYERIIKGGSFRISRKEKEGWEKRFKIDMSYFVPGDTKEVLGKNISVWSSHFDGSEYRGMQNTGWADAELEKILEEINSYIHTPYYSIYYYLCNNMPREPRTNVQEAIRCLNRAKMEEWKGISGEEAEESLKALRKHYRYLSMKLGIEEIEKNW